MAGGAVVMFGIVFALSRSGLLSLRYALGWMAVSALLVLAAIVIALVGGIGKSLPFTPTGLIAVVGLGFEPEVLARAAAGSIYRSYNMVMDQAAELEGLEALVMLHQDAEVVDPDFCRKVRESLADPDVGVVGCVGAVGVRSIAWWDGAVTWASFTHRYSEFGGGAFEDAAAHRLAGRLDRSTGHIRLP